MISTNSKNRIGFETYLNIRALSEGKHYLTIDGPHNARAHNTKKDAETVEKTLVTIPFWYFPQSAPKTIRTEATEVESVTSK